jgi:hypothetical protein
MRIKWQNSGNPIRTDASATTAARPWISSPDAVCAGQERLLHWKEGPAASSPRRGRCSS